jgi:2-oxoglutarate dehydrogenase complex dehydrogenase (E1) component-like enzyme
MGGHMLTTHPQLPPLPPQKPKVNLRAKKPLVLFAPKYLLHHTPATSALADFTTGTYFNRVIADGTPSDNTRHRGVSAATGEPWLVPPERVRRVVVCSGQIYYALSRCVWRWLLLLGAGGCFEGEVLNGGRQRLAQRANNA